MSVLWSVSVAIVVAWALTLAKTPSSIAELMRAFFRGAGDLLPIATILLLALALGDVAQTLGTGPYIAGLVSGNVPGLLLAPLVFVVSAFIAFSVGSSWGTFAIMIHRSAIPRCWRPWPRPPTTSNTFARSSPTRSWRRPSPRPGSCCSDSSSRHR